MAGTIPLAIVTPTRVLYEGDVAMFRGPGTLGSFQVFPGHLPLISTLEVGEIDIRSPDGKERAIATSGGFVEVLRSGITVLAETAEFADEIDARRAEEAVERARKRLAQTVVAKAAADGDVREEGRVDRLRAEQALLRALNRLRIAQRAGP